MKALKIIAAVVVFCFCSSCCSVYMFSRVNKIQRKGEISLSVLKAPVTIMRDGKGVPYIYAESLADGITAQGFVTAQDRLHQLEIIRLMSLGRFAELTGQKSVGQDRFFRALGLPRNARKHAKMLNQESRQFIQWYVNGINAYITQMQKEHPVELKLDNLTVEPWTIEDVLSFLYLMGFTSAGNFNSELMALKLSKKLGVADTMGLLPITVGPDGRISSAEFDKTAKECAELKALLSSDIFAYNDSWDRSLMIGSNNWVVAPKLTKNKAAILAGDPHLTSNRLPCTWYPTAIITPEYRMVGTTIPGAPGFYTLRTNYIAIGLTNSYIDCQDIYVETIDPKNPKNYLEGKKSIPFTIIQETIKVRDEKEPTGYKELEYPVMLTKRGPVFFKTSKEAWTVRWSPLETMTPSLSMYDVIRAKSVNDLKRALKKETIMMFNRTFVDNKGNIGWHTTGRIPIRSQKSSAYPQTVKGSKDNWVGWIPFNKMPNSYNPRRGWIGNANNRTVDSGYPYYLSSQFASHYRFARMKELLSSAQETTPDDHWGYQWDTKNMLAVNIAPVFAKVLSSFDDTKKLGETLAQWDFHDDKDKSAPAIFQIIMTKTAYLTYKDELGETFVRQMLDDWYFWQVRFERMIVRGKSKWFDIKDTKEVETMNDIIHQAGLEALDQYGDDPEWGDIHKVAFPNSRISEGCLKSRGDGGTYSMSGSGETLYRGKYHFNEPFNAYYFASMRMVVDMADNDKVLAVLPGGTSGRISDPHYKDQVKAFMSGEKLYWWFSDEMIKEHAESTLTLTPEK